MRSGPVRRERFFRRLRLQERRLSSYPYCAILGGEIKLERQKEEKEGGVGKGSVPLKVDSKTGNEGDEAK